MKFTPSIKIFQNCYQFFIYLAIFLPIFISCQNPAMQIKNEKKFKTEIPHSAFSHIRISRDILPAGCPDQEDKPGCLELIKKLPVVENNAIGSGIIMDYKGNRFILTAAHVCSPKTINSTVHQGFKINLRTVSEIKLILQDGSVHLTKIKKLHRGYDLCMLEFPEHKSKSIQGIHMSPYPPKRGDEVYNIAAPLGITGKNLTLIYKGFYSGNHDNWFYYTIPAKPGSSGSAILNDRYQLVGTINVAVNNLETLGLGTGWHQIKNFLDN